MSPGIESECYIIINSLAISPHSGNKPKKFDSVHQTVSLREGVWSGHETKDWELLNLFLGSQN